MSKKPLKKEIINEIVEQVILTEKANFDERLNKSVKVNETKQRIERLVKDEA